METNRRENGTYRVTATVKRAVAALKEYDYDNLDDVDDAEVSLNEQEQSDTGYRRPRMRLWHETWLGIFRVRNSWGTASVVRSEVRMGKKHATVDYVFIASYVLYQYHTLIMDEILV